MSNKMMNYEEEIIKEALKRKDLWRQTVNKHLKLIVDQIRELQKENQELKKHIMTLENILGHHGLY